MIVMAKKNKNKKNQKASWGRNWAAVEAIQSSGAGFHEKKKYNRNKAKKNWKKKLREYV